MKQLSVLTATVLFSLSFVGVSHAKPHNKQEALLVELTGKDIAKGSDIDLYAEIVSAYENDDEILLKSRLQSFMTYFPKSSYADNALFLVGRRAADHGNYPDAIRYFARIEKEYPRSNKYVAARYAKAMTYKKMNLPQFSRKILTEVRAKYPGSPESFRADSELKIVK
jgi:TolA-binding protein